jgi:hypothetical protein
MCPGNPENFFKRGFALQKFFDGVLSQGIDAFFDGPGARCFRIRVSPGCFWSTDISPFFKRLSQTFSRDSGFSRFIFITRSGGFDIAGDCSSGQRIIEGSFVRKDDSMHGLGSSRIFNS